MRHRYLTVIGGVITLGAMVWLQSIVAAGQAPAPPKTQTPAAREWKLPRTAWGDPDFQGVWFNGTLTPWERPKQYEGRKFLTDEEVAKQDQGFIDREAAQRGTGGAAPPEWYERGRTVRTKNTSLITDPPDGRLPALTPEGKKRTDEFVARNSRPPATYLDRGLDERCLQYRGLPFKPTGQNNNYNIVQTPTYVAIHAEHIHDTRIIYLDGRPHLDPKIKQWLGDSRGHWEGDTLVVDTTNFYGYDHYYFGIKETIRVSDQYHITERFRRVGPSPENSPPSQGVQGDMIDYTFTVEDPLTFTKPFSGVLPFVTKLEGIGSLMFESSCHEGDHGIDNMLTIARELEKKGQATYSLREGGGGEEPPARPQQRNR